MDRNREARRVTMAAAGNGLSRRRHRAGGFRDSPEDDGPVELPEAARLRDRGGSGKKERERDRDRDNRERERERERDRSSSRSKRRRGDRLMMMHGNIDDGGDDSSEESVNDDEEYEDGGVSGGPPPSSVKMLPPASNLTTASFSSSLSNHHCSSGNHHHNNHHPRKSFPPAKVFRSSPSPASTPASMAATAASPLVSSWKAADEMIGVSVPRKARSASTKRPHDSWASSATAGGVFAAGDQIYRQVSTSPARGSPGSMLASPSPPAPPSPSSSGVSVRKKMPSAPKQKPHLPKSSSCKSSSSPMAAQDEIEIEIAEVLYGMMRQPLGPSKLEAAVNDSGEAGNVNPGAKSTGEVKSRVTSPISNSHTTFPQSSVTLAATNSTSSNVSAIAPKRKRPRPVKYEDENNTALPSRLSSISSAIKAEAEAPSKAEAPSSNQEKIAGSTGENSSSVLESTNPPGLPAHPPLKAERGSNPSLDSAPVTAEESEKRESNLSKEESTTTKIEGSSGVRSDGDGVVIIAPKASLQPPEKEKFEIDLMAPPPARSSPERDGKMDCVAAEAKPKATDVETDAKSLPTENDSKAEKAGCKEDPIREPEEKKQRTAMAASESTHKTERNTELKLDLEKPDRETVAANKLNHHHHHVQKQTQQQLPGGEKAAQASPLPLHMSMPGWPGGLPSMGYMAPTQGVVPADSSSLQSATMQPPHLFSNQPRPKRCATHCYIARNIHYHQQFTKMNPFWPAAAGSAPLYGAKACNLSLMPSTELQGNVLGRSSNSAPDKSYQSTPPNSSDTSQRKQILLQQALPPGGPSNILHGPAFIFPLGQQPHAAAAMAAAASVRPPMSGNTASSSGAATSASTNGSAPAGATTMSFSYPNMTGNETQYLAILQNNGYPFPVPAHVGAPPAYRGAPGQSIPFFNGSFYSSPMIHPSHLQPQQQQQQQQQQSGQGPQGQAPSSQNPSISSGSSAAQKHLQSQQQRPAMNPGNLQGFPTQKVQSQLLSFQQRQQPRENATQQSETAGEDSPSTADSRASRSNVAYGQNFPMPNHATNLGLMNSAASGGAAVGSSGNHGEKKPQQQGSKSGVESLQSQAYAMTFATFNGASAPPGLNMPSIAQNHAIFHTFPEAARQGYHQMMAAAVAAQAAQQKMNYSAPEDGKSGSNASANDMEERKSGATGKTAPSSSGGQSSIVFSGKPDLADASVSGITGGGVIDSSARLLNLSSAQARTSGSTQTSHQQQQQLQRNQPQQQYTIYLQKQQQYAATAAAVAATRSKGPVTSSGSVFPDHGIPTSLVGCKFPNANSGFPQNLVQSSGSPVQSPQWKNNSSRTTTAQVQSPSILSSSSASSSLKNVPPKQQGRPQQSQISFAANSKSLPPGPPMQLAPGSNQAQSPPMLVGSPTTSSVSKNAGGSPRTTASASTTNKAGQVASQPSKNSPTASGTNSSASSAGGRNGPSILGNPHVTPASGAGSKSQPSQQPPKHTLQQAQLFFSNPYMQQQQQQMTISTANGYYLQRHQQPQGSSSPATTSHAPCPPISLSGCTTSTTTATSDPAKAIAAAAAAATAAHNMKGGNLQHSQGVVPNSSGGLTYTSTQPPPGKAHHHHQLVPPGFPYVHAVPTVVQVKPGDQKQQAGE